MLPNNDQAGWPPTLFCKTPVSLPEEPGSYLLCICLSRRVTLTAGALGSRKFLAGYYYYAGSAQNGIRRRCSRYLNKTIPRPHWHIDYLITCPSAEPEGIIAFPGTYISECAIIKKLSTLPGIIVHQRKFGSSDCRKDCGTHLLFSAQPQTNAIMCEFTR